MKGPDGPFTIPLLAKNNKLTVTVGGHNVQLTASIERWFIYHLYVGEGKGIVIRWFREVQYISCLPHEYDAFISQFIQQHPKTTVEGYSLEVIPMQSDGKNGLALPIPYYECIISEEAERELMNLFIKSKKKYQARVRIVKWLKQYCEDYGYCFPQCEGEEYEYLYNAFLEQHGISSYAIRELEEAEEARQSTAQTPISKHNKQWPAIIFRAIIFVSAYAGLMWLGWYALDTCDDIFVGALGGFMFFGLLGVLLAMLIPIYPDMTVNIWKFIIGFIMRGILDNEK